MKKTWLFLKRWGLALFGVLAAIVTLGLYARHKQRELGAVKDELEIANATKEMARLRAQREMLAPQVKENDAVIEDLDSQMVRQKRRIIEAHENGRGLTDEEVVDEFARLGF